MERARQDWLANKGALVYGEISVAGFRGVARKLRLSRQVYRYILNYIIEYIYLDISGIYIWNIYIYSVCVVYIYTLCVYSLCVVYIYLATA
jgi:hypothetical protein